MVVKSKVGKTWLSNVVPALFAGTPNPIAVAGVFCATLLM